MIAKVTEASPMEGPLKLMSTPLFTTGKTDQFTRGATEMACVHNILIRGFNSIYFHAPIVQPSEYKDFVGYSLSWFEILDAHHRGEETMFFPELEKVTGETGLMECNISQHKTFCDGLEAFDSYLSGLVKENRQSDFSAEKLIEIMDSFKDALSTHLDEEIPTILGLSRFGDKLDLLSMMEREGKAVMGKLSKFGALPFVFFHQDTTYEGGLHANFPPVPAPVRFLACNLFSKRHPGFWKFATCDGNGRPKAAVVPA